MSTEQSAVELLREEVAGYPSGKSVIPSKNEWLQRAITYLRSLDATPPTGGSEGEYERGRGWLPVDGGERFVLDTRTDPNGDHLYASILDYARAPEYDDYDLGRDPDPEAIESLTALLNALNRAALNTSAPSASEGLREALVEISRIAYANPDIRTAEDAANKAIDIAIVALGSEVRNA